MIWMLEDCYRGSFSTLVPEGVLFGRSGRHGVKGAESTLRKQKMY